MVDSFSGFWCDFPISAQKKKNKNDESFQQFKIVSCLINYLLIVWNEWENKFYVRWEKCLKTNLEINLWKRA